MRCHPLSMRLQFRVTHFAIIVPIESVKAAPQPFWEFIVAEMAVIVLVVTPHVVAVR